MIATGTCLSHPFPMEHVAAYKVLSQLHLHSNHLIGGRAMSRVVFHSRPLRRLPSDHHLFCDKTDDYGIASERQTTGSFWGNSLGHCRSGRLTNHQHSHWPVTTRRRVQRPAIHRRLIFLVRRSDHSQRLLFWNNGRASTAISGKDAFQTFHGFSAAPQASQHYGIHNFEKCLYEGPRCQQLFRSRKRNVKATSLARVGYSQLAVTQSNHRIGDQSNLSIVDF